ncbi:MAG: 3-methyl-2-oxobutanoate hydroxymethyltransferase [Bdellovibrionaceae bacterium]|nr:3-methyl-2-oxobutanoate hydroxymethyltransferase [Pseudobdellovibrionaceae bacterium]
MTIQDFQEKKSLGKRISMITCYDYSFARLINESQIDAILVGDSAAMVMHGADSTLIATMEMMEAHTRAVAKGAPNKLVIADMPFLSYRMGLTLAVENAGRLMRAGAQAVKLEGADGNIEIIQHLLESGIPVMGHLGLTPQSIHQLGGFKVQAKTESAKQKLIADSQRLQQAGCFSLVLECVPSSLANKIASNLEIPVIGIGAGPGVDGQVLVLQDLLGMNPGFRPKFLRTFLDGHRVLTDAFNNYHAAVISNAFPSPQESYE